MANLLRPKKSSTVHKKYLVPALKLAVYHFPEELAVWALHLAGVEAHSNTRLPSAQTKIAILDPIGRPFGNISFESDHDQSMMWVIVDDVTATSFFINTIETYLTEVLGIVLPENEE